MPVRECVVLIPAMPSGHFDYDVQGESSLEAAWRALQAHERRGLSVADNRTVRVIVEGRGLMLSDCTEHNAKQPQYRHRVARVRRWARERGEVSDKPAKSDGTAK